MATRTDKLTPTCFFLSIDSTRKKSGRATPAAPGDVAQAVYKQVVHGCSLVVRIYSTMQRVMPCQSIP